MAIKTDERLLNLFNEASGGALAGSAAWAREAGNAIHADSNEYAGPGETASFDPSLDSGAGQSFHGTSGDTSAARSGGGSNPLESIAASVFGGALGLVPLVGSIVGLFGDKSTQPQTFEKYQMPSSIAFEAADTGSGLANADYGQMGLPRVYDNSDLETQSSEASDSGGSATAAGTLGNVSSGTTGSSSGMPPISVNVQ